VNMDLASSSPQAGSETPWTAVAATLTLLLGGVTVFFWWSSREPTPAASSPVEEEEDEPEKVHEDVPPEHMPEGGIFTKETLAILNGEPHPLCMGVCGKVVNVSASQSIRPGTAGYGALWAGRDATYSLATLSLKAEDASKMDFKLADFTDEQKKALAGWYKHFTTKYKVIGTMREYDGWDFSEIELLAKDQTPFGLSKDGDAADPESDAAAPESDAAAPESDAAAPNSDAVAPKKSEAASELPAGAQVFKKGARLRLRNLASAPEKNGLEGILDGYSQDVGRFIVILDNSGETILVKPDNLLIL